jgi:hypothetical protein
MESKKLKEPGLLRFCTLFVITFLVNTQLPPAQVSAATTTWNSSQFGIGVSWQDPWSKVIEESVAEDFDMVRLSATSSPLGFEMYGIAWSDTDPSVILQRFVSRFRASATNIVVVQNWENCGCKLTHPMMITYTSSQGMQVAEALEAGPLPGGGVYVDIDISHDVQNLGLYSMRDIKLNAQMTLPSGTWELLQTVVPTITPAPYPTPTAQSAAARRLIVALRTEPWLDGELQQLRVRPTSGERGLTPDLFTFDSLDRGTLPNEVVFEFDGGGIGYLVEENADTARVTLDGIFARLAENDPRVEKLGGDTYVHLGRLIAHYSVVDNVIVVGYFADFESDAYDLWEAGVAHLERVKASVQATPVVG